MQILKITIGREEGISIILIQSLHLICTSHKPNNCRLYVAKEKNKIGEIVVASTINLGSMTSQLHFTQNMEDVHRLHTSLVIYSYA